MFIDSADTLVKALIRKTVSLFVCAAFFSTSVISPAYAQAVFSLPQPGQMVELSDAFHPVVLKGVSIHPEDPLLFDFIVDNGQTGLEGQALTDEATTLVKYFLAGLAVPEKELWVNLSPVEKDRIMPDQLSHTDVGYAMLAQDYILKQITSSLMYPEKDLGRKFWDEIYKRAYEQFGSTDVPVDTLNKVWIMPEEATVYQNGNNAFVSGGRLKVMLESDYQAMAGTTSEVRKTAGNEENIFQTSEVGKAVMREVIIPILEKEVNEGKNFAQLRQVFQSMILAGWYKHALKESLLNQVYADTNKVNGIESGKQNAREEVYAEYMKAFQAGVYNYIKEEFDQHSNQTVARKYFSGGITDLAMAPRVSTDKAELDKVTTAGQSSTIAFRMAPSLLDQPVDKRVAAKRAYLLEMHDSLNKFLDRYEDRLKYAVLKDDSLLGLKDALTEFKSWLERINDPQQARLEVFLTAVQWEYAARQKSKRDKAERSLGIADKDAREIARQTYLFDLHEPEFRKYVMNETTISMPTDDFKGFQDALAQYIDGVRKGKDVDAVGELKELEAFQARLVTIYRNPRAIAYRVFISKLADHQRRDEVFPIDPQDLSRDERGGLADALKEYVAYVGEGSHDAKAPLKLLARLQGFYDEAQVNGVTNSMKVAVEVYDGSDRAQADQAEGVLSRVNPTTTESWRKLEQRADRRLYDLRTLFAKDPTRAETMSLSLNPEIDVDFSKNLIDAETLKDLLGLADEVSLKDAIEQMFSGEKINETENRAVLHVALRNVKRNSDGRLVAANGPVVLDGKDVMPEVIAVLEKIEAFTKKVQSGEWKGFSGETITDVVNIGIGGSDLGPKMAAEALRPYKAGKVNAHFVSNIDGTAAAELMRTLDPKKTLVVVVSKTFTTQETMQNAETFKNWVLKAYNGNAESIKKHFVACSTAKELVTKFGIDPQNMFEFWDWVGGRYSVWSAVGLTLATYIGFDNFLQFLEGGREADEHFRSQSFDKNIPVLKALLNVWYGNFLKAESFALLPYDQYMSLFPAFAQQFFMESNGKSVDRDGKSVDYNTGLIAWGAAGTDGQHSFYQLIHQGTRLIPADFIGVINTQNPLPGHHDKLFSNFVAQTEALAFGATAEEVRRDLEADPKYAGKDLNWHAMQQTFTGNKPTTSILVDQITPKTLGNLIALYEQQIFTEGVIWNIFSFDQWGVQLGKVVATKKVLPFLDGTKNTDQLADAGLSASSQRMIDKYVAGKKEPVASWETIDGNINRWLSLAKNISLSDINLDMYRDYDYRYVKNNVPLKPEIVFLQTLIWAKMALAKAEKAGITTRDVLVARDARKIEPEIVDAEIAALRYAGLNVVFIGDQPNCVTSYSWAVQSRPWLMTIFNTASHVSQPEGVFVRGFKVTQLAREGGNVLSLSTKEIKQESLALLKELLADKTNMDALKASQPGSLSREMIEQDAVLFNTAVELAAANKDSLYELGLAIKNGDAKAVVQDVIRRYENQQPLAGLKVVVEGSNTPSGPIAAEVFKNLGASVEGLNLDVQEISGLHNADPSIDKNLEALKKKIQDTKANFGIAFDLDGDRGAILIPEWNQDGTVKAFHMLAPDNLLGVLTPSLLNDWGYASSGKKVALIRDVLGTYGVNDAAKKYGIEMFQTDAGYVYLKAKKEQMEPQGYVFPVYGERSGHTWLHVAGEIENPIAVAVLFADIIAKNRDANSANAVLELYQEMSIPYAQSPRFQPFYHPGLLKYLSGVNTQGWAYEPGVNPPQAIVALGKDETVKRLSQAFPSGKSINGYVVAEFNSYQDPVDEGGLYRFADVMFNKDGKFAGRVVVRASSNDPTFVMSYEAPKTGWDAESAAQNRMMCAGLVMKFMINEELGIFTRGQMKEFMNYLAEDKREVQFNKSNLGPVEADYEVFTAQETKILEQDGAFFHPGNFVGVPVNVGEIKDPQVLVVVAERLKATERFSLQNFGTYAVAIKDGQLEFRGELVDTKEKVTLFLGQYEVPVQAAPAQSPEVLAAPQKITSPEDPRVVAYVDKGLSEKGKSLQEYKAYEIKFVLQGGKEQILFSGTRSSGEEENFALGALANIPLKGGIDLGSGNYLKVIATDAAGMPKFDPAELQQLRQDLRGLVPVPVSAPQPVNMRVLLGLEAEQGNNNNLKLGQLEPLKFELEEVVA